MSAVRKAGLRATQRWFLEEIERAHAVPRRPRRARGASRAAEVVLPSPTLAPEERVAIYGRMYMSRLEECLGNDYPVVKSLLGPARFCRMAHRFVTRHPPRSWTLNDLGAPLPGFLCGLEGLPRAALVRDVARLERAMSEAFDAEDATPLSAADIARAPAAGWPEMRLEPAPSLRVLALGTAANRVVTAIREGRTVPRPLPAGPSHVAVYRKDLRVWRLELTRPMHAALSALVRGRPLGAALLAAGRAFKDDPALLPGLVRGWFALWIEEGLFARVSL